MMNTKEIARKPNARTKVQCEKCKKQFPFSVDSIVEEQLPNPYNTVVEGLLVCPHCGLKKHSYYMTEVNRFDLSKLNLAIETWHKEKTDKAYRRYQTLHNSYKNNFDKAQVKYKALMNPEVIDGKATTN